MWRKNFVFLLLCAGFSYQMVQAIVVGSFSNASRQSFLFFPETDSDNEIQGFVAMDKGFALESPNTSIDFNGFSIVNGPILLNGGTLNLLQDLVLGNGLMQNGGIIMGNTHIFTVNPLNAEIKFSTESSGRDFIFVTDEGFATDANEVSWSPNSDYLAMGTDNNTSGNELFVLSFNGTALAVDTSVNIGAHVWTVDWHPTSSSIIAVGTQNFSGDELITYDFNSGTSQLTVIDSKPLSARVYAVRWSPNGNYLAVGERTSTSQSELYIYSHVGGVLTLVDSITINSDLHRRTLDWAPNNDYLAIGLDASGNTELRVYNFNGTTISLNAELEIGIDVRAVSWSPVNDYIAVGLNGSTERLRLYQHNAGAGTLTEILSGRIGETRSVLALDWNSDGTYLAFGRNSAASGTEFRIYSFDVTTQIFTQVEGANETNRINSVRWSPDDSFIAFGSDRNFVTVYASVVVGTTLTFNDTSLRFTGNVSLNMPLHFQGSCELHGNNQVIDLSTTGSLIVEDDAQLLIKDTTLKGVHDTNICCTGTSSVIILSDVTWIQDANYTFTQGTLQFKHDVQMSGDAIFAYQTNQTSTILADSRLILDNGFTFSYDPMGAVSNDLIEMIDQTSQLLLNGATLHTTGTGLQLSKGELVIAQNSYLSSENTDGITFGDGTSDLACTLYNGINLEVLQGGVTYRNTLSSSMDLREDSVIEMAANSTLNLLETLYLDNSLLLYGNNVTVNYVDGVDIVGDTGQLGSLNFNVI